MHRQILGLTSLDKVEVDHINGNGLDNQRENLRICSHAENMHNTRVKSGTRSCYKGVFEGSGDKWVSQIRAFGKKYQLGTFQTEQDAALAYDEAARRLHGEYAYQNIENEKISYEEVQSRRLRSTRNDKGKFETTNER